jgi:hypothetical protein
MRKTLFAKKVSFLYASMLIFSVLFTAIVYACSGLDPLRMAFHDSSMNTEAVERGPCSEHKQEVCKSVRHRMLSIQASASQPVVPLQSSTVPQEATLGISLLPIVSILSLSLLASFHPSFKLSLPFFYRVLRI